MDWSKEYWGNSTGRKFAVLNLFVLKSAVLTAN